MLALSMHLQKFFKMQNAAKRPAANGLEDAGAACLCKLLQCDGKDTESFCSCLARDNTKACRTSASETGRAVVGLGMGLREGRAQLGRNSPQTSHRQGISVKILEYI